MKKFIFNLYLAIIIIISFSTYGQVHPGAVASQGGASITNYVFDGTSTSYFGDEASTPTMLDGIVNQTLLIRVKRTVNSQHHGLLGCGEGNNLIKIEVDADDNKADVILSDTGNSAFTNATVSTDLGWHVYILTYTTTVDGLELWEDGTKVKFNADLDFTARTAGRPFLVGAINPAATPYYLIGEVSDAQIYNRQLNDTEVGNLSTDLTDLPTDHATSLVANFAGNKTSTLWTSEVGSYVLTNKGGVTTN